MRRFLFASIALTLLFPAQVSAAELSALKLLALPSGEPKPVNFSLAVTEDIDGVSSKLAVVGAREGSGAVPDKFWATVDLQRQMINGSMRVVFELRIVHGTAYMRVASAQGSDPFIDIASLQSLGQGWVSFPAELVSLDEWTMPPLDPSQLTSAFSIQHTRFFSGSSYKLSLVPDAMESFIASVNASLPDAAKAGDIPIAASLQADVKVDTTRAGDFRFFSGSIRGSALTVDAKVQRQMRPVNVEKPKISPALTGESLDAVLSLLAPISPSYIRPDERTEQPAVEDSNDDIGSELRYLPENNPASVRRLQRETQRSLKHPPLTPRAGDGRALIDRAARRQAMDALQAKPPALRLPPPPTPGHEPMLTLATLLSVQVRPADLRAAFGQNVGGSSVRMLYGFLSGAQQAHPELTYLYFVRPTDRPDTFRLVVDSYTFAPLSVLDVNRNGKVDPDEQPARVGTRYVHELFTQALLGPVIDVTLGEDIAAYVPVRDEEGNAIAVLGVVEKKNGDAAAGAGRPAH